MRTVTYLERKSFKEYFEVHSRVRVRVIVLNATVNNIRGGN
jgi:hypothetical protein